MRFFSLILLLLQASSIFCMPYVVTSYIEVEVTVFSGFTYSYTESGSTSTIIEPDDTWTSIIAVSPTGMIAPTGITTFTEKGGYSWLTVVDVVLPKGVGVPITATTSNASAVVLPTSFYVPVTYEPFSTCHGKKWTYPTTIPIYVPPEVQTYLTPLVVSTKDLGDGISNQSTALTTNGLAYVSALLNPTDVPVADYSSVSSAYQPAAVTICKDPTESRTPTRASATSTATETVDSSDSSGIQCGKSNPNCQGCTYYSVICIGNGCTAEDGSYYECQDGKKYYEGGRGHSDALAMELAIPLTILGSIIVLVCIARCRR